MTQAHEPWRPSANLWAIAMAVMLPSIMEVLDTTMANVALPQMAGSLAASQDESTWVLTSYLVSNAIVLPMTDWLSARIGRKRFLMICVVFFTLASAWCGAATSMPMLILARVIQGAAGGGLIPLSQAILMESAPPEKRGMAMAVFGLGVMAAPVVGPALGGWITYNYSWRWMFLINVPVGMVALFLCQVTLEDPPYLKAAKKRGGAVDIIGFCLMALWLATLQVVLDKGQEADWFETPWIAWFSAVSVVSMLGFIIRELTAEHPIVNLRVFKNVNFAVGTGLMAMLGVLLYATVTLQPLFLQQLLGYTSLDSGMALSPRGIGAMISMILAGKLVEKTDGRVLIGLGFAVLGIASLLCGVINLEISQSSIVWPNVLMGLSLGFLFVPLSTVALGALPQQDIGNASGIFNLMRNLGGSIGISLVTTLLARGTQTHQNLLAGNMSRFNPRFMEYYQAVAGRLSQSFDPVSAKRMAMGILQGMLGQQANLLAYVDNFRLLGVVSLACVAAVLLLRRQKTVPGSISIH
jgi:DHA2 family multidrug resistance protein